MAFGPPICACCGATEGVEAHHLYSRKAGCPDDLTVWLCGRCHGRTHGMRRRLDIRALSMAGLVAAKARGVKLGNPNLKPGDATTSAAAREEYTRQAQARAARLLPLIEAARTAGAVTLRETAAAMEAQGIRTPSRRGRWHPATVLAVQRMAERAAPVQQLAA